MNRQTICVFVAAAIFAYFSAEGARAGTTGALSGTVLDPDGHAVAQAHISIAGPSDRESTTSDARGAFAFASLAPDTYVLSVEKTGFEPLVLRDVRITADATQTIEAVAHRSLREIGRAATSGSGLVRPGTTRDVYSVSSDVAQAAEAIGAGADLQNAYSAIATVPGAYVPFGQSGAEQTFYIRGGQSNEVGFEYDGVPVNRSFDNAAATTLANLGQQELQVYTNGGDDGASSSGTAGFINQVIRTGTSPGFADAKLGIGSTSYYHGLTVEAGGATPNRLLSYYVGLSGYNQDYRYLDQFNGAGQPIFNSIEPFYLTNLLPTAHGVYPNCTGTPPVTDPFGGMPPVAGVASGTGCYTTFPPQYGQFADVADREAVVNVHAGIPHRHDGGKDDVQFLFSSSYQVDQAYSSSSDAGVQFVDALLGGPPTWPDTITWPSGTKFGQSASGLSAVPYYDPGSPPHSFDAPLPVDDRDAENYNDGIVKVQYQKNFGSNAYARLYLYSLYSARDINGPSAYATGGALGTGYNYDYELDTHTRGAQLKTAFTLGSKHFINATLNAVTATTSRINNENFENYTGTLATNLTDGTLCYAYEDGAVSGVDYTAGRPAPCNSSLTSGTFGDPTRGAAPAVGPAAAAGATWRVTYSGNRGFYNTVTPNFSSASISDTYRPNARLTLEGAVRFDRFDYRLADTSSPGQEFWFAAGQHDFCYNPKTNQPLFGQLLPPPLDFIESPDPFVGAVCPIDTSLGYPIQTVHPDGLDGHGLLSDSYDPNESHSTIEPRIGLTYAAGPDTVLRASYGSYAQGPIGAFVQYNTKQENLASTLFLSFWGLGFTTPRHESLPETSDDFDLSYEHRFHGTDVSVKVSPYYRASFDQVYGVATSTVGTAFNTGTQQDKGIEFELTKGNFKRDGFSFLLSYAYLSSREKFVNYPGTSQNPIDPYNNAIEGYNALTKAGGGAPCYANSADSTPDPTCGPTSIRNPYYGSAPQPLLSRTAWYPTGLDYPYLSPHTITLIANYRHKRFSVTPSLQITAGPAYGNPGDIFGLDPRTCTNNSAGITGSAISTTNPLQADYTSCGFSAYSGGQLNIPNPQTGTFDRFGDFQQPWHAGFNAKLGYDVAPHTNISLTLANLLTRCFGGSRTPWSTAYPANASVCSYQQNPLYVSNFYNGTSPNDTGANGAPLNPHFSQPYIPSYSDPNIGNLNGPFNAYLQVSIGL